MVENVAKRNLPLDTTSFNTVKLNLFNAFGPRLMMNVVELSIFVFPVRACVQ